MQYEEIEAYFKDDTKLEEFLSLHSESFKMIEEVKASFQDGSIDSPDAINDAMIKLTGAFMSISFTSEIIKSIVESKENTLYNQAMLKEDPMLAKVNTTTLKRDIMEKTKNFRRVNSIFKAYVHSCDKALYSCQSSLKSLKREKFLTR